MRWEIFENSSHMPHVEETERCLKVVGDFLDRERAAPRLIAVNNEGSRNDRKTRLRRRRRWRALARWDGASRRWPQDRAALMEQHRGGTMRLVARAAGGTIDPHINYTLQELAALPVHL